MIKSVFGIATTQGQAEQIVQELQSQGFATSEISVLMPDTGETRDIGHVKATKVNVITIVRTGKAGLKGGKAAEFRYLSPETENGTQEDDGGFEL
jgi:hypothetical protein